MDSSVGAAALRLLAGAWRLLFAFVLAPFALILASVPFTIWMGSYIVYGDIETLTESAPRLGATIFIVEYVFFVYFMCQKMKENGRPVKPSQSATPCAAMGALMWVTAGVIVALSLAKHSVEICQVLGGSGKASAYVIGTDRQEVEDDDGRYVGDVTVASYEFTVGGTRYQGVATGPLGSLSKGDTLNVSYYRGDPAKNRREGDREILRNFITMAWFGVFFAFCTIKINFPIVRDYFHDKLVLAFQGKITTSGDFNGHSETDSGCSAGLAHDSQGDAPAPGEPPKKSFYSNLSPEKQARAEQLKRELREWFNSKVE